MEHEHVAGAAGPRGNGAALGRVVELARSHPLLVAVLISMLLGLLFIANHVGRERVFYFWDYVQHYDLAVRTAGEFRASFANGVRFVGRSLGNDYNALHTVPLVPFIATFGERRPVYLSAVFVVYHLPLIALAGAWLRRLYPERPALAAGIGAAVLFCMPNYWYVLLRGYPDVCGAVLIALSGLLYVSRPEGEWKLSTSLFIGLALGGSILLRRHYAYAALAFLLAASLEVALSSLAEGARLFVRRAQHLVVTAAVAVAVVALVAPSFLARASTVVGASLHASWEVTPAITAKSILLTVGLPPLVPGLLGFGLTWRRRPGSRPTLRFLLIFALTWVLIWTFWVRQNASHYCHVVPFAAALGIGALLLQATEMRRARVGAVAVAAVSGLALFAFLQASSWSPALSGAIRVPLLWPRSFAPLRAPGYDRIAELVGYLREQAAPGSKVLVAASSDAINHDLLRSAQATLYPHDPARLVVLSPAQVDSEGDLPAYALFSADLVVVARPFQQHLKGDRQRVVRTLFEAFQKPWAVAADFERLPREFALPLDEQYSANVQVWRRVRPTSRLVQARTLYLMKEIVAGRPVEQPEWRVLSSLLKNEVSANPDGTAQIIGHPARGSERPETIFESDVLTKPSVTLSATVEFFDSRCIGSALAATTDAAGAAEVPLGVFTPALRDNALRATLPETQGRRVRLILRTSPEHPENHGHCTLSIQNLRLD